MHICDFKLKSHICDFDEINFSLLIFPEIYFFFGWYICKLPCKSIILHRKNDPIYFRVSARENAYMRFQKSEIAYMHFHQFFFLILK
jgi:hypothetical protein